MLIIYTIAFIISIVLYYVKLNAIASGLMIALAIFLYAVEYKKTKRFINIRGLFAFGFIGGFGLSLLKLSKLSSEYSLMTILVVYLAYFSLYIGGFYFRKSRKSENHGVIVKSVISNKSLDNIIMYMIMITFIAFMVEVAILRFVPLFTIATPHAYSTFHVYMLHYITSLYIFIPSFAICNYYYEKSKKSIMYIIISYLYVIILATLMLSRGQLLTSIIISVFVYIIYCNEKIVEMLKNIRLGALFIVVIVLLTALYIFITVHRAHDVEYLMEIFDMKNKNIPVYIAQPYMYVAHNFENLNFMICNITDFGFGRMTLMPIFTLTLAKKIFPFAIGAPSLIIKTELSTKTLVYDFYYDFGIIGVIVFCFIIGYIGSKLEDFVYVVVKEKGLKKYNYLTIIFSLFSYYMLFSFMQPYFSLTDTWFNIIVLLVITSVVVYLSVVKYNI